MSEKTEQPIIADASQRKAQLLEERARQSRNLWLGLILVAFVAIIFAVTYFRLGADVMNRPL